MPIPGPPFVGPSGPRPPERIAVTWTAPDGGEWPLAVPRANIRAQATNAFGKAIPVEVTVDPNPRGGVTVRHIQDLEQYLIIPVLVRGDTHQEFVQRWESLGDAFTQTKQLGPGWLRVQRPDGSARQIEAVYQSGWEGRPEHGWDWDVADALTLLCPRPWWRSTTPTIIPREFEGSGADFYDPYRTISSGRVLGDTNVTNPGTERAWPLWTVTGPLDLLTATNHRTGEQFVLDPDWDGAGPLDVGEMMTIRTEDPVRVRDSRTGDTPATGAITGTLWGLDRGVSAVTFTAAGAAAGTKVELRFDALYGMA